MANRIERPLIGMVCRREQASQYFPYFFSANPGDPEAIQQAGGLSLILPPISTHEENIELMEHLEGLYLAGGGDISPRFYQGTNSPFMRYVDEERDRVELDLAEIALHARKPILAICRGLQVLNVAHGGTLVDDIAERLPKSIKHSIEDGEALDASSHVITIQPGTTLMKIYDKGKLKVNSFHHQAVDNLGKGLTAAAHAPDGVLEAVENPDQPFCVGVQWHPEYPVGCDEGIGSIFSAFIEACRRPRGVPNP